MQLYALSHIETVQGVFLVVAVFSLHLGPSGKSVFTTINHLWYWIPRALSSLPFITE